jgi:predicted transcriptional regulator
MISDILSVIIDGGRQGAIISAISRRANMSHYTAIEKCQKLIDAGLIESSSNNRSRIFVITEKGIQFFQEIKKVIETAQVIKIRY